MTVNGHRFEIGTLVRHIGQTSRAPVGKVLQTLGAIAQSYSYLIVERITQECHGGKQYSYRVRGVDSITGTSDAVLREFQEFELAAIEDAPTQ